MDLLNDLIKEPFGAAAARELCRMGGLFQSGRLYRRIEISDALRKEFVRHGGASGTTNAAVATVLKKWLLTRASPFRKEMRGRYRFLGLEGDARQYPGASPGGFVVRDAPLEIALSPELEIGAGPCEVYAWCMPGYMASGDGRWPVQFGRAGIEGFNGQLREFQKCLPERPRYLLRLGCADMAEARRKKSLLNAWFTERGQEIAEALGNDWFKTNPDEIDEAVQDLMEAEQNPVGITLEEMDKLFSAAFKDVPDEEWANLPDDLIDRLDEYLYGVDRYRE